MNQGRIEIFALAAQHPLEKIKLKRKGNLTENMRKLPHIKICIKTFQNSCRIEGDWHCVVLSRPEVGHYSSLPFRNHAR
jgi:hypothetical protein